MAEHLFFVGPGRAGLSLGYALWQTGGAASLTYCGRRPDPPPHPLFIEGHARYVFGLEAPEHGTTAVILGVPDEVLPEISVALASHGDSPGGCAAFHLSGAMGTEPLGPLLARGYSIGTLHPLQTMADPVLGGRQVQGIYFSISGDPNALSVARRIVSHLGGQTVSVPVPRRPLYHAAAVLASNYLTALMTAAARLMAGAGVPEDEALAAILPLARGALENMERMGPAQALTGPISRGDLETIRLHLRTLEPREKRLYSALGLELLHLARERNLGEDLAAEIKEMLERTP